MAFFLLLLWGYAPQARRIPKIRKPELRLFKLHEPNFNTYRVIATKFESEQS